MLGTAWEIARAVRSGELDPMEPIEQALAKIAERDDLNALITVCPEPALARARNAEPG
ncbi:MAG: hypothetical protein JO039_17235, partial [Solirubrobacterales bacterium]|nr:hypothetical protein [Solirubrobacterales bacterium]